MRFAVKIHIFITVFVLLICLNAAADEEIYDIAGGVSEESIQNADKISPGFSFDSAVKNMMTGGGATDLKGLGKNVLNIMLKEIRVNIRVLGGAAALAVLCGILSTLRIGSFGGGVKEITFFICYMVITGITVTAFSEAAMTGRRAVDDIVVFTSAAVPAMGTLLVSSGSAGVFAALNPPLMIAAGAAGVLIKTVAVPAVYMSLALCLVSNLSEKYSVRNLAELIRKTAMWLVCGALTVFCAIIGITGFAAGTLDGVTVKTLKFAAGSSIPVLGGILAESVEAVAGGALVLKNAAGAAGMLFIIFTALYPLIKISAVAIVYRLAAAVIEPVSDKRIAAALSDMATVLGTLGAMIAAVSAAMIVVIAILINASNMGAMLR